MDLLGRYMIGEDGAQNVPHREWLLIFDEVQNILKADLKEQGREDEFIGAHVSRSTIPPKCSKSPLDYIYRSALYSNGGAGLVLRRLYFTQERIPPFDCRSELDFLGLK